MTVPFKSSVSKNTIRSEWCTPILKTLLCHIKSKYFYLGLPGPYIEDIHEWTDMIGRVCAFEKPDKDEYYTRSLDMLEANLMELRLKHQIRSDTYFGLIEEVMINKQDLNGKIFVQNDLVTLYQLDFCQAISGHDQNSENHRYEAIRCLIKCQTDLPVEQRSQPFVTFLTVRNEIHTNALANFMKNLSGECRSVASYIESDHPICYSDKTQASHPMLDLFVYHTFSRYFDGNNITALFLPTVMYTSGPRSQMAVYTMLGSFAGIDKPLPPSCQSLTDFLSTSRFELQNNQLVSISSILPNEDFDTLSISDTITYYINKFVEISEWDRCDNHFPTTIGALC